jgi:hypothetical protein
MRISVKQGRGPSFLGGIAGIFMTVIALFIAISFSRTSKHFDSDFFGPGPRLFNYIPILFVFIGIVVTIYNFYNVFARNRLSQIDIMDQNQEPDPFNSMFSGRSVQYRRDDEDLMLDHLSKRENRGRRRDPVNMQTRRKPELARSPPGSSRRRIEGDFCPYCGKKVSKDFDFCPGCGSDI